MAKASVTYTKPEGDSDVVETLGYKFFDGIAKEIDDDFAIGVLSDNKWFKVEGVKAKPGPKPKSKDDVAAIDELGDH